MLKKQLLVLLSTAFLTLAYVSADAQVYKSAVGIRFGYPWAASYKTFISESSALEVYAGYRGWSTYNWFSVNGAYQIHKPFPNVENLQWYFGGGAGVYFWSYDFDTDADNTSFSIQGYLGLDYTFEEVPVSLSLDWVPTFFFTASAAGMAISPLATS